MKDVFKTSSRRLHQDECLLGMICHYWFSNNGFKFQHSICNSCYDLTMLSVNIWNIAIITIIGIDYHCIIHNISKSETIHFLKSSALADRGYI